MEDLSALVAVTEQARQAIMESLQYQSTGRRPDQGRVVVAAGGEDIPELA